MGKYISIDIGNKDCKGMFLFTNTDLKTITSTKEANKLIGRTYKIQLRVKVDNKRGKKVFSFESNKTTFLKAIEFVASKRVEVRESLKENGTVREKKKIDETILPLEEGETFLDKVETFLETKEISARKSTIQNYSTALNIHSKPLHNKSTEKIKINDVQKIINKMLSNRAEATVVLYTRTLRAFLAKHKAPVIREWNELSLPHVDNKVDYKFN